MLCLAGSARAERVVVLELDGDGSGQLRRQIEEALGELEVVSLDTFKAAAAKKKMKGAAAMTPVGVSRAGKTLAFDAAVGGEVTGTAFKVVIYDRVGEELWSKTLTVSNGLLSDDVAKKLSRAIAAAAAQGAAQNTARSDSGGGSDDGASGGLDLSDVGTTPTPTDEGTATAPPKPLDPNRDLDLDVEATTKRGPSPPLIRFALHATTTWRGQCLRPVLAATPPTTSCAAADASRVKAEGVPIDYTAEVPYLGFEARLEAFPLARFDNRALQGFGVLGQLLYGGTTTRATETTSLGPGPVRTAPTSDLGWAAQLAWRFHFGAGFRSNQKQPVGFAGVRAGVASRSFSIDPSTGVPLPSSQRAAFPLLGLDVSVPVFAFLRLEGELSFAIGPRPAAEQIFGFGNQLDPTGGVISSGWSFDVGLAGDIWGPIGYSFRVRRAAYADQYFGAGRKWTVCNESQCGGVAEESYVSVLLGLTIRYD
ncbi:MAG: hypothetical protein JNG84_07355 [Archangium sp.]|nr:hypothetical protein [Archangium sp.]